MFVRTPQDAASDLRGWPGALYMVSIGSEMGRVGLTALAVGDPSRRSIDRRPAYAHRQYKQAAVHHNASCALGRSDRPFRPWCVLLRPNAQLDRQAFRPPKCWALASSLILSRRRARKTGGEVSEIMADLSEVDVGTDPPSPTPQPMTKCRSRRVQGRVTKSSGAG